MHDGAQSAITQQLMKARVETMFEFQHGEWSLSDVPETVHIYNQAYPGDAFAAANLGDREDGRRSPQDNNPADKPFKLPSDASEYPSIDAFFQLFCF